MSWLENAVPGQLFPMPFLFPVLQILDSPQEPLRLLGMTPELNQFLDTQVLRKLRLLGALRSPTMSSSVLQDHGHTAFIPQSTVLSLLTLLLEMVMENNPPNTHIQFLS